MSLSHARVKSCTRAPFCDQINRSLEGANQEEVDATNAAVGKWFSDYLVESGYTVSFEPKLHNNYFVC
jgi:hypothetical protein